ncbi:helix-turn-helix transcriptional regulator [Dermatophilus congolensis]|uniref:Iron-sulfur cluster biosynthesis transcriptional regulator SufR n=1 Tax=Dermatophilus congolensis TaxID=1863 RepID=A0A239VMI3_9MICO|nr:winged helix-turn-helix transcriptional regulator [Dermatophilus congolensis]MBO3129486.1 winged helix-turn-helix transcriptional regulator [Dermatophilus congolensis]MBO3131881.1 winged helix-turn-helix transcriptional regulator [Dermatophilus congolensis]MBO3133962.1 winged helix-turn-helix transcriptional regulator [Dermatophilus congolensis]MBO3136193.1 winged helix-turn-helix transcriptional regulator [Dermatophilus congolensis]MBO3138439.1 winged helix-turn-helix transcriptional regul
MDEASTSRPAARAETLRAAGAGTREQVLRRIVENGPITAAQIAEDLELTPAAVRRHLTALEEEQFIAGSEANISGRGRGRPARVYVVTDAAHRSLDAAYDDIARAALRFLSTRLGPEAVEEFAAQRAADLVATLAPQVEKAGPDPISRAVALAEALTDAGFAATARSVQGPVPAGSTSDDVATAGVQLCQGHCPVQTVAAEYQSLCDAEAAAFADLLGVHVQRLSTLAGGGHVCTTFVPAIRVHRSSGADVCRTSTPRAVRAHGSRTHSNHEIKDDERTPR